MQTIKSWITDIYEKHGWQAAIIVLAVVAAVVIAATLAGIDVGSWLGVKL